MSTNELQKMTWGRKAAQRFSKSPEEIKEEVLRSLRGKLSVEFQSYAEWERVDSLNESNKKVQKKKVKKFKEVKENRKIKLGVATPKDSISSLCFSWTKKFEDDLRIAEDLRRKENEKKETLLKTQIVTAKITLSAFEGLHDLMMKQNFETRSQIEHTEEVVYSTVTRDLERSLGYSHVLHDSRKDHVIILEEVRKDLEKFQRETEAEIEKLEKDVSLVESKLKESTDYVQMLRTYKGNQYPVTVLQITQLQEDLEKMDILHQTDIEELNRITKSEMKKLLGERHQVANNIVEKATMKTISKGNFQKIIEEITSANKSLSQEIDKQKMAILKLEAEVEILQKKNKDLKDSKMLDVRKVAFSDVIMRRGKFLPNDELVLDIKTDISSNIK